MCYNLPAWLREHFELDQDQLAYLDGAPEAAKFASGAQFAAVVVGRGPVTMDPLIKDVVR